LEGQGCSLPGSDLHKLAIDASCSPMKVVITGEINKEGDIITAQIGHLL
jgi:hypothetical protein